MLFCVYSPTAAYARARLGARVTQRVTARGVSGWSLDGGPLLVEADAPVKGRVCVGNAATREALLMDLDSPAYLEAYRRLSQAVREKPNIERTPLWVVNVIGYHVRQNILPCRSEPDSDKDTVDRFRECIASEEAAAGRASTYIDVVVPFSRVLGEWMGICVYNALLATAFGQQLLEDGLIAGTCSYETGSDRKSGEGTHAFMRYTAPDGSVWICDSTQGTYGALLDCVTIAVAHERSWNAYLRAEDVCRLITKDTDDSPMTLPQFLFAAASITTLGLAYLLFAG